MLRFVRATLVLGVMALVCGAPPLLADEYEGLPEGPIRERHELMENIGAQAKKIGTALKAGKTDEVPGPADTISRAAQDIASLFPPGSTHEKSRAKPEIWENKVDFDSRATELGKAAAALAAAARSGGDVGAASKAMFDVCKGCHEKYRVPED